jgi:hypothetical protein
MKLARKFFDNKKFQFYIVVPFLTEKNKKQICS